MSIKRDLLQLYFHYKSLASKQSAVSRNSGRQRPLIVTLTSWGKRFPTLHLTLESLLNQSLKPDRIILWIAKGERIPSVLNRQINRGLEVRYCEDIGPFTKIIFAIVEFQSALLVTCDDDVLYGKDWLAELYHTHLLNPAHIICHRAHLIRKTGVGRLRPYNDWMIESKGIVGPSLNLFPTGVGGVLYPPDSLHRDVTKVELFKKFCPHADDVWLKAMSLLNGTQCLKVRPVSRKPILIKSTQACGLGERNNAGGQNDRQLKAVFSHYDLYDLID